jgi:hypothetical protein
MKKSESYSTQVLLTSVNNKLLEFLYTRFKYRYQDDLAQAFSAISSEKLLEPIHDSLNCSEDSSSFLSSKGGDSRPITQICQNTMRTYDLNT